MSIAISLNSAAKVTDSLPIRPPSHRTLCRSWPKPYLEGPHIQFRLKCYQGLLFKGELATPEPDAILVSMSDRGMDHCEMVAYDYLTKHRGFKVVREPEGKGKFPDFCAGGTIAVEARRLNQNVPSRPGEKPRGRVEDATRVRDNMQRLLPRLGSPSGQISWYVDIQYNQPVLGQQLIEPVPDRQRLEQAVLQALRTFQNNPTQNPTEIQLFDGCTLILRPGKLDKDCFVMMECSDYASGGWTIPELERNLKICIDQKTAIARDSGIPRMKYDQWWLALIDLINHGRAAAIKVPPHDRWDKVILINPLDCTRAFEI